MSLDELVDLRRPVGGKFNLLPVLLPALFVVLGEHPEKCPYVEGKTNQGQQADTCEAAQDGCDETGDQGKHTEIVGTMPVLHETHDGFSETL